MDSDPKLGEPVTDRLRFTLAYYGNSCLMSRITNGVAVDQTSAATVSITIGTLLRSQPDSEAHFSANGECLEPRHPGGRRTQLVCHEDPGIAPRTMNTLGAKDV